MHSSTCPFDKNVMLYKCETDINFHPSGIETLESKKILANNLKTAENIQTTKNEVGGTTASTRP